MEEILIKLTLYTGAVFGSSVFVCTSVWMIWVTLDKILGLLKFSKVLIEYSRHKGKCKDCRGPAVFTPVLSKEQRDQIKSNHRKPKP